MKGLIIQRVSALLLLFLVCALWGETSRLEISTPQEFAQQIIKPEKNYDEYTCEGRYRE